MSSLAPNAQFLCYAIPTHWSIENNLDFTLDATLSEDQCRIRSEYSPHNFAFLRRLVVNVIRQEKTFKGSLRQDDLNWLITVVFLHSNG